MCDVINALFHKTESMCVCDVMCASVLVRARLITFRIHAKKPQSIPCSSSTYTSQGIDEPLAVGMRERTTVLHGDRDINTAKQLRIPIYTCRWHTHTIERPHNTVPSANWMLEYTSRYVGNQHTFATFYLSFHPTFNRCSGMDAMVKVQTQYGHMFVLIVDCLFLPHCTLITHTFHWYLVLFSSLIARWITSKNRFRFG